jgi:hypothetical protein
VACLLAPQWHRYPSLARATNTHALLVDVNLNVLPAWSDLINGTGVTVGIVGMSAVGPLEVGFVTVLKDDGLDKQHPELSDQFVSGSSWNFAVCVFCIVCSRYQSLPSERQRRCLSRPSRPGIVEQYA